MFGSLEQFISIDRKKLEGNYNERKHTQLLPAAISRLQGKRTKTNHSDRQFIPDDKRQLLSQYQNKHKAYQKRKIASMKKKKFFTTQDQIQNPKRNISNKKTLSMFAKSQIQQEYIAIQALSRNHQLLRAVLRTKDAETNFRDKTDFEDSIQRMKQGYRKIIKDSKIRPAYFSLDQKPIKKEKLNPYEIKKPIILRDKPINQQKIRLDTCIKWVKKHNLKGQQCYRKLSQTTVLKDKIVPQRKILSLYQNKKMFKKIDNQIKQLRKYTEN